MVISLRTITLFIPTRSSFVTNLLEEGVSADDVCKLTGHSYSIMRRHDDRMKIRNRIPEVTRRQ